MLHFPGRDANRQKLPTGMADRQQNDPDVSTATRLSLLPEVSILGLATHDDTPPSKPRRSMRQARLYRKS